MFMCAFHKKAFWTHVNHVSLILNLEYSKDVVPTEIFKYNSRKSRSTVPSRHQSNFIHKEISFFFLLPGATAIYESVLAWYGLKNAFEVIPQIKEKHKLI